MVTFKQPKAGYYALRGCKIFERNNQKKEDVSGSENMFGDFMKRYHKRKESSRIKTEVFPDISLSKSNKAYSIFLGKEFIMQQMLVKNLKHRPKIFSRSGSLTGKTK